MSLSYNLYKLKEFKKKGLYFTFKRIILFLFRRFKERIISNRSFVEVKYGILPCLKRNLPFYQIDSGLIRLPASKLVQKVKEFWYSNKPGTFNLDGEPITRKDIHLHGGPNPSFTCPVCQKSEWLSRVRQKNLFIPHACSEVEKCKTLCSHQGDELWAQYHQNFDFSIGCDSNLSAPKCLLIAPKDKDAPGGGFYQQFLTPLCDQWMLIFRRRLAHTCQVDLVDKPININWNNYDFVFVPNNGRIQKFRRPNLPIILYGHDFWDRNFNYQWAIDWLKPNILLTSYPTQWKEYFKIPSQTKVVFYPFFESNFFTCPNLNQKKLDLLVVGGITSSICTPRLLLDRQISQLANRYNIEFSHDVGVRSASWTGKTYEKQSNAKSPIRYLNKWSEYLGSAKYVTFGRMKYPVMVGKYYETLGSGAIPIFPEVPDLKFLGVRPFEHYIPLSEIEGNNERLAYFLDHYEDFRYIAKNAVKWYATNSDKMIFDDFENLIREITSYRFPKRLIESE